MAYDYNTGQLIKEGQQQSVFNTQTGQRIGSELTVPNATPITPTIKAENIGATTQMQLPTSPTNTVATGIIEGALSGATQSQNQITQAQANVANLENKGVSEADKANQDVMKAAREALGMENQVLQDQATAEATQINPIQKVLNDLNSSIADETVAYRAEQDRIRNTPMSEGQRRVELGNLEDTYGRRLADMSIRQAAAQGNITAIQANFDRQTKLLTQPYENELKFQEKFAQKYADTLTEKENKTLDRVMQERKDLIQQTKDLQTAKANMIAEVSQNGGGTDQAVIQAIQNAEDITAVASAGSKYIGAMDFLQKQANLTKTRNEIAKINREARDAGVIGVTNPNSSQYSAALSVILGSEKFTKDQKNAVINAVNSGQDPFAVIKNQAKNIMGQTLATDLDKAETAKAQLIALDSSLKKYYANGGTTGIFTGNLEKTLNKLGEVKDPKLVEAATEIALAAQAYRLAVTGTAASVQEDARIDNVFPGITKGELLNNARTAATIKSFENKIDSAYRNTLGSTYDSLKQAETAVTSQTPMSIPSTITGEIDTALKNNYAPEQIVSIISKKYPNMVPLIEKATAAKYSQTEIINYLRSFKK